MKINLMFVLASVCVLCYCKSAQPTEIDPQKSFHSILLLKEDVAPRDISVLSTSKQIVLKRSSRTVNQWLLQYTGTTEEYEKLVNLLKKDPYVLTVGSTDQNFETKTTTNVKSGRATPAPK